MKYIEMSNKEYHKNEAMGSTMLSTILKNAKKAKMIMDGDYQMSFKSLKIGSALHKIVLEPNEFQDEFAISGDIKISKKIQDLYEDLDKFGFKIYPDECLTPSGALASNKKAKEIIESLEKGYIYITPKEKQEFYELKQMQGKEILNITEYNEVLNLKEKLFRLKRFKEYVENGIKEKSFFGEIDGVKVKCRPDLLVKTKKGYLVFDLKTSGKEATSEDFAKSSAEYLYPLQESLYRKVLEQNGIKVDRFIFAVVSKVEYSGAGYYEHDITAKEFGDDILQKALFKYKWCRDNDEWKENNFNFVSGGFEDINTIILPNYVYYKF